MYARFEWSSANAGALTGDHIYTTSVPGIGLRVKVWLNITGEYDGDTDDFLLITLSIILATQSFILENQGVFRYLCHNKLFTRLPATAGGHGRRNRQQQLSVDKGPYLIGFA